MWNTREHSQTGKQRVAAQGEVLKALKVFILPVPADRDPISGLEQLIVPESRAFASSVFGYHAVAVTKATINL